MNKPRKAPVVFSRATSEAAARVEQRLAHHGVELTLGGEPTYVPLEPSGPEWSFSAVGPTKLAYARAFASAMVARHLPGAAVILAPGKLYPGEANPRWSLQILARRDGRPVVSPSPARPRPVTLQTLREAREWLAQRLAVRARCWRKADDPRRPGSPVWVLPLDYDFETERWRSERWRLGGQKGAMRLLDAEGPPGLRLPLDQLDHKALRRALTLGISEDGKLDVFLPPVLERPFAELLEAVDAFAVHARIARPELSGYVPQDDGGRWIRLGMAADPGVLEVNLPPCSSWAEYATWLERLEDAAGHAGLRSWKRLWNGQPVGTGGGNHILFGGPTLERNPFFPRPWWLARILRYWQAHPSLSYLFTGIYVGSASQAPRPDESARNLQDLEMAYDFLESLGPQADRTLINETIRHMHIDASGNTHRTEISVDKFWTPGTPSGCLGLIEFRAVESLPRAEWMSAVCLLWRALAAMLLDRDAPRPLKPYGARLHDAYFLPAFLLEDLNEVLDDLASCGLALPRRVYREIADWRLPVLHKWSCGEGCVVAVRAALEGWPLLCEVPSDGGATSRFVDTSVERLEVRASASFHERFRILLGGAEVPLVQLPGGEFLAGVRFRRSALYPCLHPGIPLNMPLELAIIERGTRACVEAAIMHADGCQFEPISPEPISRLPTRRLPKLPRGSFTHDLRTAAQRRP